MTSSHLGESCHCRETIDFLWRRSPSKNSPQHRLRAATFPTRRSPSTAIQGPHEYNIKTQGAPPQPWAAITDKQDTKPSGRMGRAGRPHPCLPIKGKAAASMWRLNHAVLPQHSTGRARFWYAAPRNSRNAHQHTVSIRVLQPAQLRQRSTPRIGRGSWPCAPRQAAGLGPCGRPARRRASPGHLPCPAPSDQHHHRWARPCGIGGWLLTQAVVEGHVLQHGALKDLVEVGPKLDFQAVAIEPKEAFQPYPHVVDPAVVSQGGHAVRCRVRCHTVP